MNKIYLETKHNKTSEYVFMQTLLEKVAGSNWKETFQIVCVNGKDNIQQAVPSFIDCTEQGGKNLVIFDADFTSNNGGFLLRQAELLAKKQELGIDFDLFLFPNNHDDGDVETLFESMMLPQHQTLLDCFRDFEQCIGTNYEAPNRKGKCHTYISSMKMSNTKRRHLGEGQWQFDNPNFWNIDTPSLTALKNSSPNI